MCISIQTDRTNILLDSSTSIIPTSALTPSKQSLFLPNSASLIFIHLVKCKSAVFACLVLATLFFTVSLERAELKSSLWLAGLTCSKPAPPWLRLHSSSPSPSMHRIYSSHLAAGHTCQHIMPLGLHSCCFFRTKCSSPSHLQGCFPLDFTQKRDDGICLAPEFRSQQHMCVHTCRLECSGAHTRPSEGCSLTTVHQLHPLN